MQEKPNLNNAEERKEKALSTYKMAQEEYYANNLHGATSHLLAILEVFRELREHEMLAKSYNLLGIIYAVAGSTAQEIDSYLQGLACAKAHGILYVELICLNNLGSHYLEIGEPEHALQFFEECADKIDSPELSDEPKVAGLKQILLENMVLSHIKQHHLYRAEQYLELVKKMLLEKGEEPNFDVLLLENKLFWLRGKKEEAEDNLPKLEQYLIALQDPADFITRVTEYVLLLKEMRADDYWKRILKYSYEQTRLYQSNSIKIMVLELCLDYVKVMDLKEEYKTLCELYVETSLAMKAENRQERQQISDVKLELFEKEREYLITKHEKLEMQELAEKDALTGLGSRYSLRRYGNDLLEKAKEERSHIVVGLLDVDCFKQYNDTYGHLAGDSCLVKVAGVLKNALQKAVDKGACGSVFRYGGDELLLILTGTTEEDLHELAEMISADVDAMHLVNQNSTVKKTITLSQGYYCQIPRDEDTLEDILKKADVQLYKVKDACKNDFLITVGA